MSWDSYAAKLFRIDKGSLSPEALVYDGITHNVLSTDPPIKEHQVFPVEIISNDGSFAKVKTNDGTTVVVELR